MPSSVHAEQKFLHGQGCPAVSLKLLHSPVSAAGQCTLQMFSSSYLFLLAAGEDDTFKANGEK